uniref:uncharacterized protein LOC105352106 isoform X2 n=1 Tax=Fragaria vesca subsp. vesca TaxID=101020 RepID=UPI0005CB3F3F|nr:PREDICTED: uncharacterized protein LOC105352106 isoform X2 [Fragaria vesca subsp. vesca]
MIGRKIPSAGKSKSFEYDGEFKMSTRIARQKRRARRARKLRNGWMFGRKIRDGRQLYPVKFLDFPTPEPEIVYVRDKDGVERRLRAFSCK